MLGVLLLLTLMGRTLQSMYSQHKSKGGVSRLLNALRYSKQGLQVAFRYEAAFRQELLAVVILMPVALWISRSVLEFALLLGVLLLVLIIELLNSAVEALADSITLEQHPLIGRAKDLGSAAVFLTLLFAGGVWLAFLVTYFIESHIY